MSTKLKLKLDEVMKSQELSRDRYKNEKNLMKKNSAAQVLVSDEVESTKSISMGVRDCKPSLATNLLRAICGFWKALSDPATDGDEPATDGDEVATNDEQEAHVAAGCNEDVEGDHIRWLSW